MNNQNPKNMTATNQLPTHAVRARRFFYGPKEETSIAFTGTLAECKEFIRLDDAEIYRTSHNESGRWRLRVVTTASLSPSALVDAERRAVEQSWK
jgi:hypothetical protein